MKFSDLHDRIPLARYGKAKSLTMSPYDGIVLAMPGRHAEDTTPKGGDFVVMVTDPRVGWNKHQFKHDDIFNDIETKYDADLPDELGILMDNYLDVIAVGKDPSKMICGSGLPGIEPFVFLHAIQCLAVAEHRRYHMHEEKFGGRFLPFRFTAGISEGLWTAADAIKSQRYGRPAVERLERKHGLPIMTKKLLDTKG